MDDFQIKYGDLSYPIYQKLKSMILSNELHPGQKILQEKIAKQLGVSRTPLLKALQMLEYEFLVESIPRRGIFVKEIDTQELIDAFECREALEGIAARRAAENADEETVKKLSEIFKPFENQKDIDIGQYEQADINFHDTLIKSSNNSILQKLELVGNFLLRTYTKGLVRSPEITLSEHLQIIGEIKAGNPESAEQLARNHLQKSIDLLKQQHLHKISKSK